MMYVTGEVLSHGLCGTCAVDHCCLHSGSLWKTPSQDGFISDWSGCPCCPAPSGWSRFEKPSARSPTSSAFSLILLFLSQILKRNESITSKAGDPPSSAILVVYLDKAEELAVSHTSTCRAHIRAPLSAAFYLWLSWAIALNNACLPIRITVTLAPCPFVPSGG